MEETHEKVEFIIADNHEIVSDLVQRVYEIRSGLASGLASDSILSIVIFCGAIVFPLPDNILIYLGKIIFLYCVGKGMIYIFVDIVYFIKAYDGIRLFPGILRNRDGSQEEVYSSSDQTVIIHRSQLGGDYYHELVFIEIDNNEFALIIFDVEYVKDNLKID